MTFWAQHEETELKITKQERLPQDAPAECDFCGHVGDDVILGVCAHCEDAGR